MNISTETKDRSAENSEPVDLRIAREKSSGIERFTDLFSDWFSPILVKETRQSLKSRQFFWTFFLLLLAVAIWTLMGLTLNNTSVRYENSGPVLLMGYWVILGFPLAIVIPFGTFRSLAREFEDGTIQLVSVTTMRAWQIVAGKLVSGLLQMLIYVSILAPCVAFTYLLRGLSIPQISAGLAVCISGSFSLCCIALFFAGVTRSKVFGVAVSILLIVIQFIIYGFWNAFAGGLTFGDLAFMTQSDGSFMTAGLLGLMITTGLLSFAAATSLISFDSDNRSTIVRVMMFVQQMCFIAWVISLMCYFISPEQIVVLTLVTAHYWLVMGLIMVGEDSNLSARVRRSIPKSNWMHSIAAFFLPGPGRGLMFAVANIWTCGVVFFLLNIVGIQWLPEPGFQSIGLGTSSRSPIPAGEIPYCIAAIFSACIYPTFFISAIYLFCKFLRTRGAAVHGVLSFTLGLLLVLSMTGFSLIFHYNVLSSRLWRDYTPDQVFNWYWTSIELMENGFTSFDVLFFLFAAGVMSAVIVVAIFSASRELLVSRTETPDRVQEDLKEERKPEKVPAGETIEEIFGDVERN